MTFCWVGDDSVDHAVEGVAGIYHGVGEQGSRGFGQVGCGASFVDRKVPQAADVDAGAVVGWGSTYDSFVVIGVALRLHQGLLAAGGATHEVGMFGIPRVVGVDHLLRGQGHLVGGAVAPVDPALGTIDEDAGGFSWRRGHAHIGVGHGVAAPQAFGQSVVADVAGKAAIPGAFETLVPA